MTSTRSLPARPTDTDADQSKPKRMGLSWTQIAAAGFASITATVILSFFSISGTLIGAAVFSMASAVGNAVYGSSLRKTQDKVLDVLPVGRADPASPTVVLPISEADAVRLAEDEPVLPAPGPAAGATAGVAAGAAPVVLTRRAWRRIALFAVVIFAFVMAVVTSVELIAGRPLTDLLRGESGSGTSLGGGGRAPAPTVTVTVTPTVVTTTPTVTQTAPPTTATTSPTTTPSGTPTTPSGEPSTGTPTDAGSATTGTPTPSQSPSP